MHPEIVQIGPGFCPICGMALEPRVVSLGAEPNPELADMSRRFWLSGLLTAPLVVLSMSGLMHNGWVELALAAPVCLWAGWPFHVRALQSITTGRLNMFTLIGLGVSVAFVYSVFAVAVPSLFPSSVGRDGGGVPVLLRGCRRYRDAGAAWTSARAARAGADRIRTEGVA